MKSETQEEKEPETPQKSAKEIAKEAFYAEWETKMSDYEPDFVYMIPIEYKSTEIFYQNLTSISPNFTLKGALLIDEEKDEIIEFKIETPSGLTVYRNATGQCIFNLELKETGIYKFIFDNKFLNSEIRVTFTLNSGNKNVLKKSDLDFSQQKAQELLSFLEKMKTERKLNRNKNHSRMISNIIQ